MVLKMNKHQSNTLNMRKEIQLMNSLNHPNILKFEAVCVHEGQLHALTEFIDGGTLEDLIQNLSVELPWTIRIEIGLNISQGLEYLHSQGIFHRDLTSKNVFMRTNHKSFTAIIGDFGLATAIPAPNSPRLPQVGSPYWMSPECLRGEFYDSRADIFSLGIIMCELVARVSADPDLLPRSSSFGVDYKAFSVLCPACPPAFLKTIFSCVSISPDSRPPATSLVTEFSDLYRHQRLREETEEMERQRRDHPVLRRFLGQDGGVVSGKKSPSEKARVHSRACSREIQLETALTVCEEMCETDPYYTPPPDTNNSFNPFATLPRLRKGRKIIGSISDNFSSCFEVPSPQVSSPSVLSAVEKSRTKSLPNSPTVVTRLALQELSLSSPRSPPLQVQSSLPTSQDDSSIGTWSGIAPVDLPLRRAGSWESGFFSQEGGGGLLSSRSIASSLLTVSDLEEDLRAASAFLSNKRTSSVFTDSLDDLSFGLDDLSCSGFRSYTLEGVKNEKYEKDIREIVEYFEKKCHMSRSRSFVPNTTDCDHYLCRTSNSLKVEERKSSPEIARSQKIENLIKKVAENKTRARLNNRYSSNPQQNLQVI